jgi:hypothetical protein
VTAPTEVPGYMHQEVIAAGAVPESELDVPETEKPGAGPTNPAERKKALFGLFEKMVLRNAREEFTAGGVPHGAVIAKELGWTDIISAKERDAAWAEFRAGSKD